MKNLKQQAAALPTTPGIYLMKDQHGGIIYVGKAKNLKNRVQSYFRHNPNHSNKVLRMIYNIASFETIDVATELDALLLECQYIQQYHPLYNRQMNFYQNYLYVGIVGHEILLSTEYQPNFLGPFRQYKHLPDILVSLNDTFLLPKTNPLTRLAVEKQIPQITDTPLSERLTEVKHFFTGEPTSYFHLLHQRMLHASEHLNFEQAQRLQEEANQSQRFYDSLLRRNQFLKQPQIEFSLPVAAEKRKYYQISYGRIDQAIIATEPPTFPPITKEKKQLEKSEVDPTDILISYYRRFIEPHNQAILIDE